MRFYFICRIVEQDGLYMFTDYTDYTQIPQVTLQDHCLIFLQRNKVLFSYDLYSGILRNLHTIRVQKESVVLGYHNQIRLS